jgi:RimJ/RimL family protein N-acetyltransferase
VDAAELAARAPRLLTTPRLRLAWPHADHALAVVEFVNASLHTFDYIGWSRTPREPVGVATMLEHCMAEVGEGRYLLYHVFDRNSGQMVASVDLHSFDFEAPRAEIGYVGHAGHAGRGYVREAVLAVIEAAFALGFARVHALTDVRNLRSQRFALSLGMVREGQLRAYERDRHGALADMVMFAAYNPAPPGPPT